MYHLDSLRSGGLFCWTPLNPSDLLMGCLRFAGSLATHRRVGSSWYTCKAVFMLRTNAFYLLAAWLWEFAMGPLFFHTPLMGKQSQWAGEWTKGCPKRVGFAVFFFWLLLPITESKEGTRGPCLPGQLNAEACRMQVLVYTYFQQAWRAVIVCLFVSIVLSFWPKLAIEGLTPVLLGVFFSCLGSLTG